MAQVSYGTITITDTTDLTTYIRYATKAPLTAASQFQETPTTDTRYIAVLSIPTSDSIPAWNSSSWKWSEFIGTDGLSVKDTRVLYYLKTNSTNVPQVDYNTSIVSTDVQNAWTSKNPTYVANGTYWTCLEVVLSDNTTKSWSAPAEDLGLTQTAKDIAEAKSIAQQTIEDAQGAMSQAAAAQYATEALAAKVKHYWWDSTGAHIASGINGADVTEGTASTYGFNSLVGLASMTFGYNSYKAVELDGSIPALKFYKPSKTAQGDLTATLNSNGLVLSEGGIKAGNYTTSPNKFIYLSTEDYNDSPTITINGNSSNWRQIIGTKFGVKNDGTLYASNVNISGTITVGNESESNVYTKTQSDNNYDASGSADEVAQSAAQSMDSAFEQLNNIVGSLTWISQHGEYTPTFDTEVMPAKYYFEYDSDTNTYSRVDLSTDKKPYPIYTLTTDTAIVTDKTYYTVTSTAVVSPDVGDLYLYYERSENTPYTYTLTNDTAILIEKTYYTLEGAEVETPDVSDIGQYYERTMGEHSENPSLLGLYELTEVNQAIEDYISTHLAFDGEELRVINDESSGSLVLSEFGVEIKDKFGDTVAFYGENTIIGKPGEARVEIKNGVINLYSGGNEPGATVNAQQLIIPKAVVVDELGVGKVVTSSGTSPLWSWKTNDTSKHLTLVYGG